MNDWSRRRSFSEREGLRAPAEAIQIGGMTEELRNSLWNALHLVLWNNDRFMGREGRVQDDILDYSRGLWLDHFKQPLDRRPDSREFVVVAIRSHFFSCRWYEIYDFLEWTLAWTAKKAGHDDLPLVINAVLEQELAGYRFIGGQCTEITDRQEIEILREVLEDDRFAGVQSHLRAALRLLSDKKHPDYRNSIKESISAVESMEKVVTGKPKSSLGEALTELEKRGRLHSALKQGFSSLYGYTSDEGGIRHAMMEEPDLSAADAKYFLLSCTSFINYLKSKL